MNPWKRVPYAMQLLLWAPMFAVVLFWGLAPWTMDRFTTTYVYVSVAIALGATIYLQKRIWAKYNPGERPPRFDKRRLLIPVPMLTLAALWWLFPQAMDTGPAIAIAGVRYPWSGFMLVTLAVVGTYLVSRWYSRKAGD